MRRAVLLVGLSGLAGVVAACGGGGQAPPAAAPGGVVEVTDANAGELADHPDRFKGRTLRVECRVGSSPDQLNPGQTLRDLAGKAVAFHAYLGGAAVDFRADVPADPAALPAARYSDELRVTFECGEGSLTRGNRATKVERVNSGR